MSNHFYHSSTKFFTALKPNSWVTSVSEDARDIAIPYVARDGVRLEKEPDHQIFIYKITTDKVIRIESELESSMWLTTDWAKVELVEYYPSWHKLFGISLVENEKKLDDEFERA